MSQTVNIKINAKKVTVGPNAIIGVGRLERGGTPGDNRFFENTRGHDCSIQMNFQEAEIHGIAAVKDAKINAKKGMKKGTTGGSNFQTNTDYQPMFCGHTSVGSDYQNYGHENARNSINLNIGKAYVGPTGILSVNKYERNGDPNDDSFFNTPSNTDVDINIDSGDIQGVINTDNVRAWDD